MMPKDATLQQVLNKLKRHTNFDFSGYKTESILRRLSNRMLCTQTSNHREYMRLLNSDAEEYQRLINELTVNYTGWFRDKSMWQVLEKHILPAIVQKKAKQSAESNRMQILRAWSAACSTGEEAYSMAMLLRESLRQAQGKLHTSIYATDIDTLCLQKAKSALYNAEELQSLSPTLRKQYFREQENTCTVSPELTGLIRFKQHNLVQDAPLRHLDIILCRNVMIYFNKELQQHMYKVFHGSLKTDGYLVLGRAERPLGEASNLFTVVDRRQHIYKKV